MSNANVKFDPQKRNLMERLFEPPAIGRWLQFLRWPYIVSGHLVVLCAFSHTGYHYLLQGCGGGKPGPGYIPFIDFKPTLDAWRINFTQTLSAT